MSALRFSESVSARLEDGVLLVTIDNPPINALSAHVRSGLVAALDHAAGAPDIAGLVITGAGRAFIGGADIREFGRPPIEPALPDVVGRIEHFEKPVVCAVNGVGDVILDKPTPPVTERRNRRKLVSSPLSAPHYHNEDEAFAYVERYLWPQGPVCPHCGETVRVSRMQGKATRKGLHKCYRCRKQFTVRQGTLFESSHLPLHVWLQAIYLIAGSKKGISSHQLARTLGLTVKTAWFLSHRIREAMREGDLAPFGEGGGAVEVDETYIGRKKGKPIRGAYHHKMAVLGLVDRNTGRSRLFHVEKAAGSLIQPIVLENLSREARLMTDENYMYRRIGREFAEHSAVHHYNKEYVRGDVTTNTVEGAFSIFKRGMRGVYQHCAEKHLHRYLAEFEFRYSHREKLGVDDTARAEKMLKGVVGKRLTYQQSCARA